MTKQAQIKELREQRRELQEKIRSMRQRNIVHAPMTPQEYREAVEHDLGLDMEQAGLLFGVSKRTSERWALAELPVPVLVRHLLWVMKKYNVRPEDLDSEVVPYAT